jgi:DNA-directed RNA polymerase specialized sigma24 family protein
MDNDRTTTKPQRSRWWWLWFPAALLLDAFGFTRWSWLHDRAVVDVVDATGDRATVAPMIGPSFPAVLAAAQRGDEGAFGKLWGDLQPRLLQYFRVASPAVAEDLAAETWVAVVRGLGRFKGNESAFGAWVSTTAQHELLDYCRRTSRRVPEDPTATGLVELATTDDPAEAALEPQSIRARPHGRAGRYRHWPSVSRCALSLLACSVLWPSGLVRRMRYSTALAEQLVVYAVALQPARYREHYQAMWLGELDWLKAQRRPLLGWAIGVAGTAVFTRLELRARLAGAAGRLRALSRSGPARAVRQAKPIWLGVLAAVSAFIMAAVSWSGVGQQGPSRAQLLLAISASVLTGVVMTWQTWPRGPAAEEPREEEHL